MWNAPHVLIQCDLHLFISDGSVVDKSIHTLRTTCTKEGLMLKDKEQEHSTPAWKHRKLYLRSKQMLRTCECLWLFESREQALSQDT